MSEGRLNYERPAELSPERRQEILRAGVEYVQQALAEGKIADFCGYTDCDGRMAYRFAIEDDDA